MLVMGGIIGSGIFMNPAVVARRVHTPLAILGAWIAGGLIALTGAFLYAELAARRPRVGGQYAYLREAYHPAVAFVYGWGLLLVTQTGGMAAVAVTFARYVRELTGLAAPEGLIAALALGALALVNSAGVRAGTNVQNGLMVLKILAILGLVAGGAWFAHAAHVPLAGPPASEATTLAAFGAALVPVLFAYGGWQTAPFVAGEVRAPERNLPRGLLLGVGGVIALYLAVSAVCLRVLGAGGLDASTAPASDVMRAAWGAMGGRIIAGGIAISTLGFLSQSMLTAPRVYFAMADDGLFFRGIARLDPRSRAPVNAILLQGALAIVIALSGRYEQILSYVVAVDWIFFGLAASCLFVLRRRDAGPHGARAAFAIPGHPVTTTVFIAVCAAVVIATFVSAPLNSAIGFALLLAGLPVYAVWRRRGNPASVQKP
jgi:APA family basic amino acid/polyamine antiporter